MLCHLVAGGEDKAEGQATTTSSVTLCVFEEGQVKAHKVFMKTMISNGIVQVTLQKGIGHNPGALCLM